MLGTVLVTLAVIALACIVLESVFEINKANTTLLIGCLSWLILFVTGGGQASVEHGFEESLLEIATLWLFLVATMTFVAYLNARGLVQGLLTQVLPERLTLRTLYGLVGMGAFLLSTIADNITTTLVCLGLLLSLELEMRDRIRLAVLVIFAINSGGAVLITGDVTTLMIYLAGKVSIAQLFVLMLPAMTGVLTLGLLLTIGTSGEVQPARDRLLVMDASDKLILTLFLLTVVSAMALSLAFRVPPALTFLLGLSLMFLLGSRISETGEVMDYVRKIEFETLFFFLGVLLIVGALHHAEVISKLTIVYDVLSPGPANYVMGILSALVDNVPLTAALLKADMAMSVRDWLCLTYAVGVGGALLVVGSAAGVVAMSKMRDLTFLVYARLLLPLLVAYTVGYGCTWLVAGIAYQ